MHKNPVKVHHGTSGTQVQFKIYANSGLGDNPAQSEVCGHIGGNGNHPCRNALLAGHSKIKKPILGFTASLRQIDTLSHCLYLLTWDIQAGIACSAKGILLDVKSQVELACLGITQNVQNQQTKNGVKDVYTQFWIDDLIARAWILCKNHPERTTLDIQVELLTWVHKHKNDIYNPFLTLNGEGFPEKYAVAIWLNLTGFNPPIDTPVEILHTILLGVIKYLWRGSHTPWTTSQKQIYAVHLQSTECSGLSIHAIHANYIMQYANSLIGRQFKMITQVNAFHVYDLVDAIWFLLMKAVGELAALLWMPEIWNMEEYLVCLKCQILSVFSMTYSQSDIEVSAANVLDLFTMIDPSKMMSKLKLHLLVHLKEDILHFGPLVGVATEVFKCFNAIFRFCSIFFNHLAPSWDIALQLAGQEALKHRLTGGWWPTADGEWEWPGFSIRNFIHTHPTLQALVGWTSAEPLWYALHRDERESAQNAKQGSSALGKTLKHLTLTH